MHRAARPSAPPEGEAATRLSDWLGHYRPPEGMADAMMDAQGRPRDCWMALLSGLAGFAPDELAARFAMATRHIRDSGVTYRVYGEAHERLWPISPLPLIIDRPEWEALAAGVIQRARLMEALLQDIYGKARMVAAGALPAAAVAGAADFIRLMRGAPPCAGGWTPLYAVDLGRGADGRWRVLADFAEAPPGVGYALENRMVLSRAYPALYNAMNARRLAPFFHGLHAGLTAAADRPDPRIALLTAGPGGETYFEQAHLARYLGLLLVEGADLMARDDRIWVRTIAGLKRVDVILRRIPSLSLDPLALDNASRLGAPGMIAAVRGGGVAMLNRPGAGVIEARALRPFLPDLCRRLLGADLTLPDAGTWWGGNEAQRAHAHEHLDSLLLAPAFSGPGPDGVTARPRRLDDLTPAQREAFLRRWADRPADYVAIEEPMLSAMPTLENGGLRPAPFVLRAFVAATPDGLIVMPGGFCRIGDDAGALSAMGEGARVADVWVLGERPAEPATRLPGAATPVRRVTGYLPSRAADNLFWLSRYLERAESALHLVRGLCASLMEAEAAWHASGETLEKLKALLADSGALGAVVDRSALDVAHAALLDPEARGSVIVHVRAALRIAASLRERLTADFWTLLTHLEARLARAPDERPTEAGVLHRAEGALEILAALAGLSQENVNRTDGWRFLDMGRRIERGIAGCSLTWRLAGDDATADDLDVLLDVMDAQITYRSRYPAGAALAPVRDLALLDPENTRSVAFQVNAVKAHLERLPALNADGLPEAPLRLILKLAAGLAAADAATLTADAMLAINRALMELSDAVETRYFLQGPNATPAAKLLGLS